MRPGLRSGNLREGLRSGNLRLRSGKLREGLRSGNLREGLPSGNLRERPWKGDISSGKDKSLPKLIILPEDDESSMESTKLDSFPEVKTEIIDDSGVGCSSGEGMGMDEFQTNGIVQDRRKRARDDDGEGCVCFGEEKMKKKLKNEISDCEVQSVDRVLRSRTRSGSYFKREVEIAESGCTDIDTPGDQNENLVVKIEDDGDQNENLLLTIEDDGDQNENLLVKIEDDGDQNENLVVTIEDDGDQNENLLVTIEDDGDRNENLLVTIDDDGDRNENLLVKTEDDGDRNDNLLVTIEDDGDRNENFLVTIDDDGDRNENLLVKTEDDGDRNENLLVKIEDDGANQRVEGLVEQKVKKKRGRPPKVEGLVEQKVKKIRGRPPKVEGLVEQKVKKKRGRPPKVKGLVEEKVKKKRGRPPKIRSEIVVVKNKLDKIKKIGAPIKGKKMRSKGGLNRGVIISSPERSTRLKRTWRLGDRVEDLETGGNLASSQESSELGKYEHNVVKPVNKTENSVGEGLARALQKKLVRDRIIALLLSAGWTIDYRPRNGKHYDDAVYVSVDGKTHWSVTKAYRLLKQRYEDGDREAYKDGFVFSPIPAEELGILNKVFSKKREGKKFNGSQESKSRADRAVRKKKKGKHSSAVTSSGKLIKRKKKGKSIPCEEDESTMDSLSHTPWSFGKRKRRDTKRSKRCTFLVRSSDGQDSESNGYVLYKGKRTTLAWMIDMGIVLEKANVSYMNQGKTKVMLEGKITKDGIDCNCCGKVITVSEFESHAGSKLCQPLQNTYLHDGISIVQYLLDAWKYQEKTVQQKWFYYIDIRGDDTNDDTCGLCGDGGNLVCCDGCPSTFHQSCLDIQKFPPGDWHCLFCSCKFCGMIFENANGREEDVKAALLLTCGFCKEKYHRSCSDAKDATRDIEGGSPSFCGKKCQEIYDKIKMILGLRHEMEEGFSWTLLSRSDVDGDLSSREISRKVECNCKIAVALSVMDECFLPMPDHRSGINLIHNIMYNCGSNFNRLDFSGFFTVTLEKGEEIIAAATIRIHGNILAEMPFIGTRYMYRRQGMCRRLLNAIESVLCCLDVEKLVIPAVSDLEETWTSAFGFEPLDMETQKTIKRLNLLVFPGVAMLQKLVIPSNDGFSKEEQSHAAEGLVSSGSEDVRTPGEAIDVFRANCSASVKLDLNVEAPLENGELNCYFLQNGSSSDITTENICFSNFATDECKEIVVPASPAAAAAEPSSGDPALESENCVQKHDVSDKVEEVDAVDQDLATSNGEATEIVVPSSPAAAAAAAEPSSGDPALESENCVQKHDASDKVEEVGANCVQKHDASDKVEEVDANCVQKHDASDKVEEAAAVDQDVATSNGEAMPPADICGCSSISSERCEDVVETVTMASTDISAGPDESTTLEVPPIAGRTDAELNIKPEGLSVPNPMVVASTLQGGLADVNVMDRMESIKEEEHNRCELGAEKRREISLCEGEGCEDKEVPPPI